MLSSLIQLRNAHHRPQNLAHPGAEIVYYRYRHNCKGRQVEQGCFRLCPALLEKTGWGYGTQLDVLYDATTGRGLLRPDKQGWRLARTSQGSQSAYLRFRLQPEFNLPSVAQIEATEVQVTEDGVFFTLKKS